jgi:hypothetical protein
MAGYYSAAQQFVRRTRVILTNHKGQGAAAMQKELIEQWA